MYVYILKSIVSPKRHYIGRSRNPNQRLTEHNAGKSMHTSKYRPWKIIGCTWFANDTQACEFEHYLKSGSGRAFAKRHFQYPQQNNPPFTLSY
ncbi:MAG: GIY-YIG nuclease family protein [Deltaproteobacteria bacterium]|nr:GIY-YIG nuclease family protein [Deltaproteobacteria bacterium]